MLSLLPDYPDPTLRQPLTLTTVTPLFLSYYALAVLAILPNTFILKLSILPFIVWQAWSCAVGLNLSAAMVGWLGLQSADRLNFWNAALVVGATWKIFLMGGYEHCIIDIDGNDDDEIDRMGLHQETTKEVRVARGTRFSGRTAFVRFKRPYRLFGSLVQSARNWVVMVPQPIPPQEHSTTVDRFDLGQNVVKSHGG